MLAAGGALAALAEVMEGRVRNAYALVRPPGHHAERDLPMGFCFINNIAVVAAHAMEVFGLQRVAIVDWDVHHGVVAWRGGEMMRAEMVCVYVCEGGGRQISCSSCSWRTSAQRVGPTFYPLLPLDLMNAKHHCSGLPSPQPNIGPCLERCGREDDTAQL